VEDIKLINFVDLSLEKKKEILFWRNHIDIRRYMRNRALISLREHLEYIDSLKDSKDKIYFLVKKGDEYIGVIDFVDIKDASAEIGLYAKPSLRGVGDILMRAIIKYGFSSLNLKKLRLEVLEDNIRAIKLYKRFGFKKIDIKNGYIYMELEGETLKL